MRRNATKPTLFTRRKLATLLGEIARRDVDCNSGRRRSGLRLYPHLSMDALLARVDALEARIAKERAS